LSYSIAPENGHAAHAELDPLYRQHYAEMKARLDADGIPIGDYNPRLAQYFEAMDGGWLLTFVVRFDGKAVGYSNVWLTQDMHSSELICQEDTIYVLPEHRNGIGRKLVKFILADLKSRGVKRVIITPVTDLRVAAIWKRMGFRSTAEVLTYIF
jgi:ribosomal protein S18 acetylase RimI-like enzyme